MLQRCQRVGCFFFQSVCLSIACEEREKSTEGSSRSQVQIECSELAVELFDDAREREVIGMKKKTADEAAWSWSWGY